MNAGAPTEVSIQHDKARLPANKIEEIIQRLKDKLIIRDLHPDISRLQSKHQNYRIGN